MNLETVIQGEVSQKEENKYCIYVYIVYMFILYIYMGSSKMIHMNLFFAEINRQM